MFIAPIPKTPKSFLKYHGVSSIQIDFIMTNFVKFIIALFALAFVVSFVITAVAVDGLVVMISAIAGIFFATVAVVTYIFQS